MNIRTAEKNDINNWMNFVDKVKDVFPGLETEKALLEHKNTVLNFMEKGLAVFERGGTALFSGCGYGLQKKAYSRKNGKNGAGGDSRKY